jgi:hypothetical protein
MVQVAFKQATKKNSKLRLAFIAPAGGGKTYSALAVGSALAEGGKVAVIDTERGSASLYADAFAFDVLELTSYAADRYGRRLPRRICRICSGHHLAEPRVDWCRRGT